MTEIISTFAIIAGIIIFGWLGHKFFEKTGFPDIVFLLLLGLFMGPIFHIFDPTMFSKLTPYIATLALLIILYEGGLYLDINKALNEIPIATFFGFASFSTSACLLSLFFLFFLGWKIEYAILLAIAMSSTSEAIVIPSVRNLGIKDRIKTLLIFESSLTSILSVVLLVSAINFFSAGSSISETMRLLLINFMAGGFIGFFAGLLWLYLNNILKEEGFINILTLAATLFVYSFSEWLALGGGAGIFSVLLFGIVLGNGPRISSFLNLKNKFSLGNTQKEFYSEISFLVRTFFFVYLGTIVNITGIKYSAQGLDANLLGLLPSLGLLDYYYIVWLLVIGVSVTLIAFGARVLAVRISSLLDKSLSGERVLSVTIPRGLDAAVMTSIVVTSFQALARDKMMSSVFSHVAFSVILSTVLFFAVSVMFTRDKKVNKGMKAKG